METAGSDSRNGDVREIRLDSSRPKSGLVDHLDYVLLRKCVHVVVSDLHCRSLLCIQLLHVEIVLVLYLLHVVLVLYCLKSHLVIECKTILEEIDVF